MKKQLLSMAILLVMMTVLSGCNKAGDYYKEGKNSFINGNYEKAIKQFKRALRIDELSSLDLDILFYMADSFIMIGNYDKALEAYTKILDYKENALVYSHRADCYKSKGEYNKSLADYDNAISLERHFLN